MNEPRIFNYSVKIDKLIYVYINFINDKSVQFHVCKVFSGPLLRITAVAVTMKDMDPYVVLQRFDPPFLRNVISDHAARKNLELPLRKAGLVIGSIG